MRSQTPATLYAMCLSAALCSGLGPIPAWAEGGPAATALPQTASVAAARSFLPVAVFHETDTGARAIARAKVQVRVLDDQGKPGRIIGQARTGSRGVVSVGIRGTLPGRVLIKVTGGRLAQSGKPTGKSFNGTLLAVAAAKTQTLKTGSIRYFSATQVTPLTTLLARALVHRPVTEGPVVEQRVRTFLGLFSWPGLAFDFHTQSLGTDQFDSRQFYREAAKHGGLDRFVSQLVREMKKKPDARHRFNAVTAGAPVRAQGPVMAQAATTANAGLISSAVAFLSGDPVEAFSKVANMAIGLFGFFSSPDQEIENQLTNIENQLTQMEGQLTTVLDDLGEIQDQLTQMENQLQNLAAQVGSLELQSLVQASQQAQTALNTAITDTAPYWGLINNVMEDLKQVISAAQQVCDASPTVCGSGGSVTAAMLQQACAGVYTGACGTYSDSVQAFQWEAASPEGGVGGILYATQQLAYAAGGSAVYGAPPKSSQGLVNLAGQYVASLTPGALNDGSLAPQGGPQGLPVIWNLWFVYTLQAMLGDALTAVYEATQVMMPPAGTYPLTPQYAAAQVNDLAAMINTLVGTFPSMPVGTVIGTNSAGPTLWLTQIASNMTQDQANANAAAPISVTNGSSGVSLANTVNPGQSLGTPLILGAAPQVATLLPPNSGQYAALYIGFDSNGAPVNQGVFQVSSGPLPITFSVATGNQLFNLYTLSGSPIPLLGGQTLSQWAVNTAAFNESIIAQGVSIPEGYDSSQCLPFPDFCPPRAGLSNPNGIFLYFADLQSPDLGEAELLPQTANLNVSTTVQYENATAFVGVCAAAGDAYCLLPTWAPGYGGAGLFDLNNGRAITNQAGHPASGDCTGTSYPVGDAGLGSWANTNNWLAIGINPISINNIPCGTGIALSTGYDAVDQLTSAQLFAQEYYGFSTSFLNPVTSDYDSFDYNGGYINIPALMAQLNGYDWWYSSYVPNWYNVDVFGVPAGNYLWGEIVNWKLPSTVGAVVYDPNLFLPMFGCGGFQSNAFPAQYPNQNGWCNYSHPAGLRTLFAAPIPSDYCLASFSASSPPSACLKQRTVASDVCGSDCQVTAAPAN